MDQSSRLQSLLDLWAQEPADPFLRYALATEYRKFDPAKAQGMYEQLMADQPNYTATYYHLASLYRQMGEPVLAVEVYEKGLVVCRLVGDRHALNELQRAYQDLQDEDSE